jgi:acetyl esterase/lipase
MGGDSAGGGITNVVTQRLSQQNKTMPILQILIYPWLQMINFRLPSTIEYKNKSILNDLLSLSRFSLVYFGKTYLTNQLINILDTNQHFLLIENQELKNKYKSYLSVDLIPKEYKEGRSYYSNFNDDSMYPTNLADNSLLNSDLELKKILKMLNHLDLSPSLVDDNILKLQPKSYFVVFEWDVLKDENLIFAERLKRNGVQVDIAFYEKIFHGGALFIEDLNISRNILDNLIEYIRQNI